MGILGDYCSSNSSDCSLLAPLATPRPVGEIVGEIVWARRLDETRRLEEARRKRPSGSGMTCQALFRQSRIEYAIILNNVLFNFLKICDYDTVFCHTARVVRGKPATDPYLGVYCNDELLNRWSLFIRGGNWSSIYTNEAASAKPTSIQIYCNIMLRSLATNFNNMQVVKQKGQYVSSRYSTTIAAKASLVYSSI